jgi:hypothetical protein
MDLKSNLSRKDNPDQKQKIIGRPSPTAIARDTERVTKFLISPKGILFNIKQFAQQLMNPNMENVAGRAGIGLTKIYDPLSPITNTIGASLGLRTDRHWPPVVRTPLSTYEGIHKTRKSAGMSKINNRLVHLTNELILGKTSKIGGLLSTIQDVGSFLGYKGAPIQTLSGLTGPKSLGGIGATTIRRHEDTTKANLKDQFETKLQTEPGLLGNTAPEVSGIKKTKKEVSLLGKYKAVSYGQIPKRNHSTTIIDFRKLRDIKEGLSEEELEKEFEKTKYLKEENRKSNFSNTIKLIETIDESVDESLIDFQFNDIKFKAYLGMISDNFAPSWDSTPDQGRADPRYQYTGFERTISFDFMVAIENPKDATIIWKKLQDLARLTHPVYGSQGFFGQTADVTIGKLFNEKPMIIQDLGYDWDNETPWEIDEDYQHPLYTNVNMTCIVLGNRPQSNSVIYDIPGISDG